MKAALNLAFIERVQAGRPLELSCLAVGGIRILHLPGEPFIEYQLFAQAQRPDLAVFVAGYGDDGTGYIPTANGYLEGGYEPTQSPLKPEAEVLLLQTLDHLADQVIGDVFETFSKHPAGTKLRTR